MFKYKETNFNYMTKDYNGQMRIKLENNSLNVEQLNIMDPINPASWTVSFNNSHENKFSEIQEQQFKEIVKLPESNQIDIGHDLYGRREYLCFKDVLQQFIQKNQNIKIYSEDDVNTIKHSDSKFIILFARYNLTDSTFNSYNIIDDLSNGNNKLILSDESTLTSNFMKNRPNHIFNNISVIINCAEANVSKSSYQVKCNKVVSHPIHKLGFNCDNAIIEAYNEFNEAIWEGIQTGGVVIHCLAGMHRAPTVVVSHQFYRQYKLGHKHINNNFEKIYKNIQSFRHGVEPLSYKSLLDVQINYLKKLKN